MYDSTVVIESLLILVVILSGLLLAGIILYRSALSKQKAVDANERRRSSAERERLLTLVNAIGDAIFYTGSDGRIRLYNASALSLIDTNQSLRGRSIDSVLPLLTESGDVVDPSSIGKAAGSTSRSDLKYQFADGESIDLDILVTPMRANYGSRGSGRIYIVRDITKAKTLDEERDEFISVVSHELRTPVTIVEGSISNAQLLLERGIPGDRLKAAFNEAHKQILYLASMVNDLSTLSRAERGVADTPESINVEDLIRELYREYEPQAAKRGLHLEMDAGTKLGTITTSRLYLEEILQNFITNAIKYTEHGKVTFTVRRESHGIYFGVKDSGIGISKSDQKKIFNKFYRSEDYRTRATSGTGLGLYVVAKLAKKLKIDIEVTSRLNYGSTFSFIAKDL